MGRLLALLVCFSLAGCSSNAPEPPEPPLCRVVTQIALTQENASAPRQRVYRAEESMNRILSGISLLGHKFIPGQIPPAGEPDDFTITLYFSDGNQKIYRYHALRYLYIQGKGWTRVNEELGETFLQLLQSMPQEQERSA